MWLPTLLQSARVIVAHSGNYSVCQSHSMRSWIIDSSVSHPIPSLVSNLLASITSHYIRTYYVNSKNKLDILTKSLQGHQITYMADMIDTYDIYVSSWGECWDIVIDCNQIL